MKKPMKVTRQAQYDAMCSEADLGLERVQMFRGCVKINLEHLDFTHSCTRPLDEANVDRLVRSFELAGCLREESNYHIPAVLDDDILYNLTTETGVSSIELLGAVPSLWPRLKLPTAAYLTCLHGQHRIEAARRYLLGRDRWWVVDVYSSGISLDLRRSLAEQTFNEVVLSPGQIYFHMLRSNQEDVAAIDAWRARIQTRNASEKVRQLFGRRDLSAAFRQVAQIPAFGDFMQAGNIDALLGVKCDEEVIHYLKDIASAWSYFVGGEAGMCRIDRQTIELIQLRCPANCAQDRDDLTSLMEQGTIFAQFHQYEREEIWQNLLVYHRRIPSLHAFFEDLKYLRDLASCVSQLFSRARKQTVRQACWAAFEGSNENFDHAYRQLWIFIMRDLRELQPCTGRVEYREHRESKRKNSRVVHEVAQKVYDLGYRSSKIENLLQKQPDRVIAEEAILTARRPTEYEFSPTLMDFCVGEIIKIFDRGQRRRGSRHAPELIIEGEGEFKNARRCGRPHTQASQASDHLLSFENLHVPDSQAVGGLSPFYIRRDVYRAFFGFGKKQHIVDELEVENDDNMMVRPLFDRSQVQPSESSQPSQYTTFDDGLTMDADLDLENQSDEQSLYTDQDVPEEITDQAGRHEMYLAFIKFVRPGGDLLEEVPVRNENDHRVELAASAYFRRGLILQDGQSRSVHPTLCLEAAMENPCREIVVAPRWHGRKRQVEEISDDGEVSGKVQSKRRRSDFDTNDVEVMDGGL